MTTGNHQQAAEALAADLYSGAKLILLTEDGTLDERLARSFGEMAVHATQLAEQLPADLGRRILSVHSTLTGGPAEGEGHDQTGVRQRIAAMPRSEQIRVAMDIADLADSLDSEVQTSHAVLHPPQ